MTDKTYTLYSTETCTRCPLARGSLNRANVNFNEVKLDMPENADLLSQFKEAGNTSVPMVLTPSGELLTNLATISEHLRGQYVS